MKPARRSPFAFTEDTLERIEEAGMVTPLLVLAIVLSILMLRYLLVSAHAAQPDEGPTPSNLAGLLVDLVPVLIAVVLMSFVFRRSPDARADTEPYGDTTGFEERQGS